MPDRIQGLLESYKAEVKKILGASFVRMVVYGSYARGDYRKDSDIDIMILTALQPEEIGTYAGQIYDLSYDFGEEYDMEINPVVQSQSIFEYWKKVYPFYMNVEKEGVAV